MQLGRGICRSILPYQELKKVTTHEGDKLRPWQHTPSHLVQLQREELYREVLKQCKVTSSNDDSEDGEDPSDVSESDSDPGEEDLNGRELRKIIPDTVFTNLQTSGVLDRPFKPPTEHQTQCTNTTLEKRGNRSVVKLRKGLTDLRLPAKAGYEEQAIKAVNHTNAIINSLKNQSMNRRYAKITQASHNKSNQESQTEPLSQQEEFQELINFLTAKSERKNTEFKDTTYQSPL